MYDQLQAIEDRYEELGELLSDPEVISDTKRFMQLSKEEANTRETVEVYRRYKEVVQGITDTEELLGEKLDDEMAELAKEELSELKKEKEVLEEKIKILLLPKDPNDDKNIIMEIVEQQAETKQHYSLAIFSICTKSMLKHKAGKQK